MQSETAKVSQIVSVYLCRFFFFKSKITKYLRKMHEK